MRVHIGCFVLDPTSRQLLREGVEVPLSPKAFDLLVCLVANRPRAVTKLELHARLWPDTFVVDANLTNLVAEVRKALDDNARAPRFVRTVHRCGYAFAANIDADLAAPAQRSRSCSLEWDSGRVTLGEGEHVIGREPAVGARINDPSVSRQHARLRIVGGEAVVEDLGSKNGTFVNGERIATATRVSDGDAMMFGSVRAIFRVIHREPSTKTVTFRRS